VTQRSPVGATVIGFMESADPRQSERANNVDDASLSALPSPPPPAPLILAYATPLAESLVAIRAYSTSIEAEMVQLTLASQGIAAKVVSVCLSPPGGSVRLMVSPLDELAARQILDEIDQRRAWRLIALQQRQLCPRCQSRGRASNPGRLAAGLGLLGTFFVVGSIDVASGGMGLPCMALLALPAGGLYFLVSSFSARGRRCISCGHTWTLPAIDEESEE